MATSKGCSRSSCRSVIGGVFVFFALYIITTVQAVCSPMCESGFFCRSGIRRCARCPVRPLPEWIPQNVISGGVQCSFLDRARGMVVDDPDQRISTISYQIPGAEAGETCMLNGIYMNVSTGIPANNASAMSSRCKDLCSMQPNCGIAQFDNATNLCTLYGCGARIMSRRGSTASIFEKQQGTCFGATTATPLAESGCNRGDDDMLERTNIANASETSYDGCVGPDGIIYALPRTNRFNDTHSMLLIDPFTLTTQSVRINAVSGNFGWNVLHHADAGKIIGIPSQGGPILIVNPSTPTHGIQIQQTEYLQGGYHGILADSNGIVYGIPANNYQGTEILIFDPRSMTVDNTTMVGIPRGRNWVDGIYSPTTQKIYGIPEQATSVLIINPADNTYDLSAMAGLSGSYKWWGGALAPDGRIFGMPCLSDSVLIIDPVRNTTDTTSIRGFGSQYGKWKHGVLAGNGLIYGIPANSPSVLIINPETNTADTTTIDGLWGPYKWYDGILAPTGQIFSFPSWHNHNETMMIITPRERANAVMTSTAMPQSAVIPPDVDNFAAYPGCCRGDNWADGVTHVGQTLTADDAAHMCLNTTGCTGFDRSRCRNVVARRACDTYLFFHEAQAYEVVCNTNSRSDRCYIYNGDLAPVEDANLALHKPVFVDSVFGPNTSVCGSLDQQMCVGERAVDGNLSFWASSTSSDLHWLVVDLENVYLLRRFRARSDLAHTPICPLSVAVWTGPDRVTVRQAIADPNGWSVIYSSSNLTAMVEATLSPVEARFVKLSFQRHCGQQMQNQVRIGSFQLFGGDVPPPASGISNVALYKPAIADSVYGSNFATHAFDGNQQSDRSRWVSSNRESHHWLVVDLEDTFTISRVAVFAGYRSGVSGALCHHVISIWTGNPTSDLTAASRDLSGWTPIVQHNTSALSIEHDNFTLVDTRLVRLSIDQTGGCNNADTFARIYELEVYGEPTLLPPSDSTRCAGEHSTCVCRGTVYYGARTSWISLHATGSIECTNRVFSDPLYGVVKSCYCDALPINIALHRPVLADSMRGPERGGCGNDDDSMCVPERAVDGNTTADWKRWVSSSTTVQHWLAVDLQDYFAVNQVNIFAGYRGNGVLRSGLCQHNISVWTGSPGATLRTAVVDPSGWTTISIHQNITTALEHNGFTPITTRMVRLTIDQSTCPVGFGNQARVYEMQVFGDPAEPPPLGEEVNCALGKPVIADSVYGPSGGSCGDLDDSMCVPRRAVDGIFAEQSFNSTTSLNHHRWISTNQSPQHWLVIDLLEYFSITGVEIYAGYVSGSGMVADGICDHNISVWSGEPATDLSVAAAATSQWRVVSTVYSNGQLHINHENFDAAVTRFVRLDVDQSTCHHISNHARIFEMLVFGVRVAEPTYATVIPGCCRGDGWIINSTHLGVTRDLNTAGLACMQARCSGFDRMHCNDTILRLDCDTHLYFHDRSNYRGGCDADEVDGSNRCYIMRSLSGSTTTPEPETYTYIPGTTSAAISSESQTATTPAGGSHKQTTPAGGLQTQTTPAESQTITPTSGPVSSSPTASSSLPVIGGIVGAIAIILLGLGAWYIRHRQEKNGGSTSGKYERVTQNEIFTPIDDEDEIDEDDDDDLIGGDGKLFLNSADDDSTV